MGDLLLLAQAESGKIPLDIKPVELDALLLEVYQQLWVLAGDRVVVKLADIDQVKLMGDRDRLKQVIINLGANAINYTHNGGIVKLDLSKTEGQAQLLVTDNGPGIDLKICLIYLSVFTGEKSPVLDNRKSQVLGWVYPSHTGSSKRMAGGSKYPQSIGEGSSFCVWLPMRK